MNEVRDDLERQGLLSKNLAFRVEKINMLDQPFDFMLFMKNKHELLREAAMK